MQGVAALNALDPAQRADKLQRKMILEVVIEKLTPLQRDINVDLKKLRKHTEDCINSINGQGL